MPTFLQKDQILEHAWKYFEIHSQQRITIFNYFLIVMAGCGAGFGLILQSSQKLSVLAILLSFFIIIVSCIFWKLDQRTSFMVKNSEKVLKNLEKEFDPRFHIFESEDLEFASFNQSKNIFTMLITYGSLFRIIFVLTILTGVVSSIFSILWHFNVIAHYM